jgi:hypothetical protein
MSLRHSSLSVVLPTCEEESLDTPATTARDHSSRDAMEGNAAAWGAVWNLQRVDFAMCGRILMYFEPVTVLGLGGGECVEFVRENLVHGPVSLRSMSY